MSERTVGSLTSEDFGSVVAVAAGPCVTYEGPLENVDDIRVGVCAGEIAIVLNERPRGGLRQFLNFPPDTPCTVTPPTVEVADQATDRSEGTDG